MPSTSRELTIKTTSSPTTEFSASPQDAGFFVSLRFAFTPLYSLSTLRSKDFSSIAIALPPSNLPATFASVAFRIAAVPGSKSSSGLVFVRPQEHLKLFLLHFKYFPQLGQTAPSKCLRPPKETECDCVAADSAKATNGSSTSPTNSVFGALFALVAHLSATLLTSCIRCNWSRVRFNNRTKAGLASLITRDRCSSSTSSTA